MKVGDQVRIIKSLFTGEAGTIVQINPLDPPCANDLCIQVDLGKEFEFGSIYWFAREEVQVENEE